MLTAAASACGALGLQVLRVRWPEELTRLDLHWECLDASERERAARFFKDSDRMRFVVARSSLRQALSQRLGLSARDLEFRSTRYGKPLLHGAPRELHFNVSHSGDWALLAVNDRGPVGIDVEAVQPEMAESGRHWQVLAPAELAELDATPQAARAHAFARAWVRKEAYVKALGEGLYREPRHIAIASRGEPAPRLLYDRNPGSGDRGWCFEDVVIDAAHVACVVRHADG